MKKEIHDQVIDAEYKLGAGDVCLREKKGVRRVLLISICTVMLALCLSACGGGDSKKSSGGSSSTEESSEWDAMVWDSGTWG